MRRALVVVSVVVLIGGLLWMLRPAEIQPAEMAPASLLGLVIVERFPDSLEFLPKTRLGEWLDLEASELQNQFEGEWFVSLKGNVERACLVIHSFARKASGAIRPHVTAFLWPKPNRTNAVQDWIRREVAKVFGDSNTTIVEQGTAQVIRGSKEGQVLYLTTERGWLILSNSEAGWKDVQLTLANRAPNLGARRSFEEIQGHIGRNFDLFFYFSGEGVDRLLPEFGYGVRIDGEEVTDTYWTPGS